MIATLSFLVGYKINSNNNCREGFSKTFNINSKGDELVNKKENQSEEYPVPECDYIGGGCPEYKMFDVDEDGRSESIVLEKVGMSQFGGRVFVIDEGKVTFVSESQMFIGVRPIKLEENDETNRNGFIIFYSKVPNANSKNDIEWAWYKYENGEYILDKITSAGEE